LLGVGDFKRGVEGDQNMIPAMKPAITRTPRLNTELGRRSTSQISSANASMRRQRAGRGASAAVVIAAARVLRG
jgi:hypothetical protein